MNALLLIATGLVSFADPAPAADDVKAGWGAFGVFVALALAVAFLGWSLVKHLRKAERNAEAGAFGPTETEATETQTRADDPNA